MIALLGTLVACTTAPDLTTADLTTADLATADLAPEIPNSPWQTETFITADPEVLVTVTILDPPPTPEQVEIVTSGRRAPSDSRGTSVLSMGTTPWRRSITGRQPVGVVIDAGRVRSAPVPPYWAVVMGAEGDWQMVAQRDVKLSLEEGDLSTSHPALGGAAQGPIHLAVGGFYPLIAHGQVVAGEFPGRTIRAPRVAIGVVAGDDPRLVIVTAGVGRGAIGGGDGRGGGETRGGLTTGELARFLQRYELEWALNLDGGRSAYLRFPDGSVWPRDVWFRRRGPVVLRLQPPETSPVAPEGGRIAP